jgi:hypothetical protein
MKSFTGFARDLLPSWQVLSWSELVGATEAFIATTREVKTMKGMNF